MLYFADPEVPYIVQNLLMGKCCLILGPPTSGTTSTLLAVLEDFQKKKPKILLWYIDLKNIPNENPVEFFNYLNNKALQLFPEHATHWDSISNADDFCEALIKSITLLRLNVVFAIDHLESASLPIATSIVRIVRLLYSQQYEGFPPKQLAVVVMAGSRRLRRQGEGKGSPLNFAEKHYIQDIDIEFATKTLLSLSINQNWHFTPESACLLATATGGDKYLLQRLGYECVNSIIQTGGGTITINKVTKILEKFIINDFLEDRNLSGLLPALVQDIDSMSLVLNLLKGTGALVPQLEFQRTNPAPSVTQVLKEKDGSVVIRNQIYRRILLRNKPIIEAARDTLYQTINNASCIRDFQVIVSRSEFSLSPRELQTALITIQNLVKAKSVFLLTYHENLHQFNIDCSSLDFIETQPISELLATSLVDAFKINNQRILCPFINNCIGELCPIGSVGNCSWIPLRVYDSPDLVGILVISGQPLVMSPSWEKELFEISVIIANAIKRKQHYAGLRQLSSLSVDLDKDALQQEICRIASMLFNKPNAFFWNGSKQEKLLHLGAAIGLDVNNFSDYQFDLKCLSRLQNENANPMIIYQDEENNNSLSTKGFMKRLGIGSLLLINVPMWQDQIGLLGIGASGHWNPTNEENTLTQLMAKQAEVILSNLSAFQQIKQRLEISRLSFPLLSHELKRWPDAIVETMELLFSQKIGTLTQSQQGLLYQIHENAKKHKQLLQKLLDFTRFDAELFKTNMKVVPILPVLKKTFEEIKLRIEKDGRDLVINLPPELPNHLIDEILLNRIFTNLIENAIQYTNQDPIQVKAWADGEKTFVIVEDAGLGIPISYREHLFEPWQRGPQAYQTKGPQGNLGLGLYLVKKMMDLLGGQIRYDEEYISGARFILTFPCFEG